MSSGTPLTAVLGPVSHEHGCLYHRIARPATYDVLAACHVFHSPSRWPHILSHCVPHCLSEDEQVRVCTPDSIHHGHFQSFLALPVV